MTKNREKEGERYREQRREQYIYIYMNNKEHIKQRTNDDYRKNKEAIQKQRKRVINCECGRSLATDSVILTQSM